MSQRDEKNAKRASQATSDEATETILEVSAQISHEIVDGAKHRASELGHLPMMLLKFFVNPYRFIRNTPDLKTVSWVTLAILSGVAGAAVNALIYQSAWKFLLAIVILPLGSFLSVFATNSILKLIFRGAHGLQYRYRSGASIFAFSNWFWWVAMGASDKFPYLGLAGFYFALSIAAVGYVSKLALPKRLVLRWFALIGILHTVIWAAGRYLAD